MRPIPVIITSRKKSTKPKVTREYKHFEVPRTWYNLPSFLLSNVPSLRNKMDEVIETVRSTCADLVAITEVWQMVPVVCTIENFELFHHLRTNRRGRGAALFCRSSLSPSHLRDNIPEGIEALWIPTTPATQRLSYTMSCIIPTRPYSTASHQLHYRHC